MKAEEEGTDTLVRQAGGDECEVRLEKVAVVVAPGRLAAVVVAAPGRGARAVVREASKHLLVSAAEASLGEPGWHSCVARHVSRCSSHCTTHASPYVCFCFFGSGMFV